jgi:excisionase family DNA binding protein
MVNRPSSEPIGAEAPYAVDDAPVLPVPPQVIELIAARAAELVLLGTKDSASEPWIGVVEAAAYLACPRSRIYELVSRNRLPFRRDGRRLLFRRAELDAYLDRASAA